MTNYIKKLYNFVLKTRITYRFFYIIRWAIRFIGNTDKIAVFKTISSTTESPNAVLANTKKLDVFKLY